MYSGKSKRILEIITRGQEGPEPAIMITAGQTKPYKGPMRLALLNRFAFLAHSFPHAALAAALPQVETRRRKHKTEQDTVATLQCEWRKVIEEWLKQPDPNLDQIMAALAAATLAGFTAAFLAWCQQNGMPREMAPHTWAAAQKLVGQYLSKSMEDIQAAITKRIEKLIEQKLHGDELPEEVADAVLGCLKEDSFTNDMAYCLAEDNINRSILSAANPSLDNPGVVSRDWPLLWTRHCETKPTSPITITMSVSG